ncbi:1-aminocyclopropane-1-carboxylate synthase [Dacryopinax primogenitus]|uniref:1-aminocyclopropane-1-carboxylate synthase n=1 Tax=Dacryopinax primogenitus (strain DJM 731) TaxID=1858805 RepID=M5FR83_DACPD|nr:1-aminocyclopropane-1-carboxylate synthase [Dacryopinax primogenitus]EJT98133.1 1-aminocyclopropane-1-carboxylate synthase [Dacryopinax primogenitus]
MHEEQVEYYNSHLRLTDVDFTYGTDLSGSVRLGKALAAFLSRPEGVFRPLVPIEPEQIVFGAGLSALIDMLTFHLCDPGTGVLIAAPYYAGFNSDLSARCGVLPVPVFVDPEDRFGPSTLDAFEVALKKCEQKGTKISAVILCNPHNPLGSCHPRATILAYARFCQKHNIHLISDEVYAYSVFSTSDNPNPEPFVSVFSIDFLKEAQCDPARVHILYGMSKDFCCNGLRAAALISQYNPSLLAAVKSTGLFMKVASPSAVAWSCILEDEAYFSKFQKENVRRLQEAYHYTTSWLKFHDIPYIPSNAGHFLLADFRKFFTNKDLEGNKLPQIEQDGGRARDIALFEQLLANKVFLGSSTAFSFPIPGWFRITFATRKDYLVVGLARIERAIGVERWPGMEDFDMHGNVIGEPIWTPNSEKLTELANAIERTTL